MYTFLATRALWGETEEYITVIMTKGSKSLMLLFDYSLKTNFVNSEEIVH